MEPIIYAKDLTIVYNLGKSNEFVAIKDASFEIYPEEYIIFFGPSGCGKSTILYCILGALPPTSGEFLVKNINPYKLPPAGMVQYQRKTVGIIYQAFNLLPSLTVLDNVSLPQIFAETSPALREERSRHLLRRFGIESQAMKLPLMLSGGQQQRVAVARSLINNPDILLADEPVGNLDRISREQVMSTLLEVNTKDKKTVILVTHDARHLPYAHRVYYLKEGMIDREVINPERPQIKPTEQGKVMTTEIEKLARFFPYLTPDELKVKSMINYLTQDMTFDQLERLENLIKNLLEGKIEIKNFRDILIADFDTGGVGISKLKAEKITKKTEKILEEAKNISRYRRHLEYWHPKKRTFAQEVRAAILDEYKGEISLAQVKKLDELVAERIAGKIQREEFQKRLRLPLDKNGLGFSRQTSRRLTWVLEKIIAQGMPT